jgi:hypothetical protein
MRMHHLFTAAFLIASTAQAGAPAPEPGKVFEKPVFADTPEKFALQAQFVRDGMQPGGRYEFINPGDRARVLLSLDEMASLLHAAGSVGAMNTRNKTTLFNDQELINRLLTHNDANRLVCESRAPTGSHLLVTRCHTFGEIERGHRELQGKLNEINDLSRGQDNRTMRGAETGERGGH